MGKFSRLGNRLYSGERSVDFVGRKWLWYSISGAILVAAILGLSLKGLNLGIEFKGGTEYTVSLPSNQVNQSSVDKVRNAVASTGIPAAQSPVVNTNGDKAVLVTIEQLSQDNSDKVTKAIADAMHINQTQNISQDVVGASWGSQVANKALTGLIVFLVLVVLFIWAYFRQWKMSVAALVALAHDILITVGVYALSGFEVTPATVTGILTILGFSLYDTVVVFDKIRENTKNLRQSRRTYAELANLAVNQTLVRSINTSIVALLPVASILYVSIATLGSGALKDLALALFVGMASGAYSSIFIATPLLVQLKAGEKEITQQDRRAKARARRDADRYANVPAFTEDLPLREPGFDPGLDDAEDDDRETRPAPAAVPSRPVPPRRDTRGSGRVVPESKAPLREGGPSKRSQPTRQPRSKRGK